MICLLKSVLSLPEIDSTLRGLTATQPIGDLYQDFADAQSIALREVAERVDALSDQGEETMYQSPSGWLSRRMPAGSPPPGSSTA